MKNVELDRIFSVLNKANNVIIYATGFTQNNFAKEFSKELFLFERPNFYYLERQIFRLFLIC